MSELRQVIAEWLESHKDEITHLRPRRWCGQWALLDVIGLPLLLCQRCANAGCTVLTARHEAEQA